MKIMLKHNLRLLISSIFILSFCGKKDDESEISDEEPAPVEEVLTPPPVVTPSAPVPIVTPPIQFWTASNVTKAIAGYNHDANGTVTHVSTIDLTQYLPTGVVTSLTFMSKDILLAIVDPGASGEKIIRIDLTNNNASAINANWYQDPTNLNNITIYSLIKWSSSKLIALRSGTSAEGIGYNLDNNITTRIGSTPFIATTVGACTVQNFQVGIPITSTATTKLLTATNGTAPRLLLYDGIDGTRTCLQSYDPTTALGLTTAHVQTGMVQMADGKIYVRYQHTTTPIIARYDFNGTALSAPVSIYSDPGVLNASVSDRELIALDSDNLLLSNWATDAIYRLNVSTGAVTPVIRNFLSVDINSIAVRPAH